MGVILVVRKVVIDETIGTFVVIGGMNMGDQSMILLGLLCVMRAFDRRRSVDVDVLLASVAHRIIEYGIMIVFIENIEVHFGVTRLLRLVIERINVELVEGFHFSVQFTCHGNHAIVSIDGDGQC